MAEKPELLKNYWQRTITVNQVNQIFQDLLGLCLRNGNTF